MYSRKDVIKPLRNALKKIFWLVPFLVAGHLGYSWLSSGQDMMSALSAFKFSFLFVALLLGLLPWLTHAFRIWIWTDFIKQPVRFKETLRIAIGSDIGAGLSPTAVGGSPVKAAMLMGNGVSPASAIVLSLISTLEDGFYFLVSFLLLFVFSGVISKDILAEVLNTPVSIHAFVYLFAAVFVFSFLYRFALRKLPWVIKARSWLKKQIAEMKSVVLLIVREGKALFLLSFLVNTLQWFIRYMLLYVLLLGLDYEISILTVMALAWLIHFVMLFVPTPGAVVGAEAAFVLAFSSYLPESFIAFVLFGWRFLTFYYQLSLGAILFVVLPYLAPIRRRLPHWMPFRLPRFQE